MKTIIAATDYSPTADNALDYAAQLAKHTASKLLLFHAFSLPVPTLEGMMALPDIQQRMDEDKARLEKKASEAARVYGIPVEAKWAFPPLMEGLEELSKQCDEPLVVVGMRGESVERKLFGSLTTSLLQQGTSPVLVVPAQAQFKDIAKILFACDYNRLPAFELLKPLQELALSFKARLQILHVEKTPQLATAGSRPEGKKGVKLEPVFRGVKHTYKEVEQEDIVEGIEKGVEEYHADMLVMVPHKPGFWDYVLNRSNTRKMALRTHIPLLALPHPEH